MFEYSALRPCVLFKQFPRDLAVLMSEKMCYPYSRQLNFVFSFQIARLFLVSDILFNSSAKVPNASHYRKQ